jgi:hypothetical protein
VYHEEKKAVDALCLQMTQQSDNWRILQSHNNADTAAAPSVRSSASVSHSNAALSSSQHLHPTLEPPPAHLLQRPPQNFDRASSADVGDGYCGGSQRGIDPEPSVLLIPHANGQDPFGGSGFLAGGAMPSQIDGKRAVQELLQKEVGFAAASTGAVTCGSFVARVLREISVALVRGNHGIFHAGVQLYTQALGHACVPGHLVPTAKFECVCCVPWVFLVFLVLFSFLFPSLSFSFSAKGGV